MADPPLAIYYSDIFKEHSNGADHPERPERLDAVLEPIGNLIREGKAFLEEPRPASREAVEAIHAPGYIDFVRTTSEGGGGLVGSETGATRKTYAAAITACGAVVDAVDLLVSGKGNRAFCAVRPPGHHAEHDRAMGFCIFNNVAVGARYAVTRAGMSRVAIVDWDVHHGNGTQNAFYEDSRVLYISLHQYPAYPGSGKSSETGRGQGLGATANFPLPPGLSREEYESIFEQRVIPILEEFGPEMVFISAGFDAHRDDPLADLELSSDSYGRLTSLIVRAAGKSAQDRIISVLEGGYDLKALSESVESHLSAMLE